MLIGGLNKIAQLCSVLFLLSYAIVNVACLGLYLASAPNFRPAFTFFSWVTCTIGFLGCTGMMLLISSIFTAVSILLCVSLILALNLLSPMKTNNWGSISQALLFHQVRKYLLLLDPRKEHVKFWRPQVLLLVKNPRTSCSLIDFANTLKKGGLFVLGNVNTGMRQENQPDICLANYPHWLTLVDHLKVKAFVELTSALSVREGIEQLVRISGVGAMKPNTILLGFHDEQTHEDELLTSLSTFATTQFEGIFSPPNTHNEKATSKFEYVSIIEDCLRLQKNVGLCRNFQHLNKRLLQKHCRHRSISAGRNVFRQQFKNSNKLFLDVWLVDFLGPNNTDITDTTSMFLLQLACIVNQVMKSLTLRVFIRPDSSEANEEEVKMRSMLEVLRIKAKVICKSTDYRPSSDYIRAMNELLMAECSHTSVLFIYMPTLPVDKQDYSHYLESLNELTHNLPPTLIVRGISPVMSTTI